MKILRSISDFTSRTTFGLVIIMYLMLPVYMYKNQEEFVLGKYSIYLCFFSAIYICYCVGKTTLDSETHKK